MSAFATAWSFVKADDEDIYVCEGCGENTLVGKLPIGGDGNLILCRDCWQNEMKWRHERNNETKEERDALSRHLFPDLFGDPAIKDIIEGIERITGLDQEPEPLFDLVPWPHGEADDKVDLEGME